MLWVGNKYFVSLDDKKYLKFVNKFITVDFKDFAGRKDDILLLFKKQVSYATALNDLIQSTFLTENELTMEFRKTLANPVWQKTLHAFNDVMTKVADQISFDEAKEIINSVKTLSGNKGQDLFMPIRLAITHLEHGPELNKIISILGRDRILKKLKGILVYGK